MWEPLVEKPNYSHLTKNPNKPAAYSIDTTNVQSLTTSKMSIHYTLFECHISNFLSF